MILAYHLAPARIITKSQWFKNTGAGIENAISGKPSHRDTEGEVIQHGWLVYVIVVATDSDHGCRFFRPKFMEPTTTLTGFGEVQPSVLRIEKDEGPNLWIAHLLKEQSVMDLNKKLLEKKIHTCASICGILLTWYLCPSLPLYVMVSIPHMFCSILFIICIDLVDGTLSTLLVRSNHRKRSSCFREKTERGRCIRISKEQV